MDESTEVFYKSFFAFEWVILFTTEYYMVNIFNLFNLYHRKLLKIFCYLNETKLQWEKLSIIKLLAFYHVIPHSTAKQIQLFYHKHIFTQII